MKKGYFKRCRELVMNSPDSQFTKKGTARILNLTPEQASNGLSWAYRAGQINRKGSRGHYIYYAYKPHERPTRSTIKKRRRVWKRAVVKPASPSNEFDQLEAAMDLMIEAMAKIKPLSDKLKKAQQIFNG